MAVNTDVQGRGKGLSRVKFRQGLGGEKLNCDVQLNVNDCIFKLE